MTISNSEFNLKNLPSLNEVIIVEETLQNIDESIITTSNLKKLLKGKITQNKLMIILDYLKTTNKIVITSKGITWIHGTKKLLKLMDKLLEKSGLTEKDAILFGRRINKNAANKFREA